MQEFFLLFILLIVCSVAELDIGDLVMKDDEQRRLLYAKVTTEYKNKRAYVEFLYPAIYKFYCRLYLQFFPFDSQECHMIFGSWTSDNHDIDYHSLKGEVGTANFMPNEGWSLMGTSVEFSSVRNEVHYVCCPNNYTLLDFTLYLRCVRTFETSVFKILHYNIGKSLWQYVVFGSTAMKEMNGAVIFFFLQCLHVKVTITLQFNNRSKRRKNIIMYYYSAIDVYSDAYGFGSNALNEHIYSSYYCKYHSIFQFFFTHEDSSAFTKLRQINAVYCKIIANSQAYLFIYLFICLNNPNIPHHPWNPSKKRLFHQWQSVNQWSEWRGISVKNKTMEPLLPKKREYKNTNQLVILQSSNMSGWLQLLSAAHFLFFL
uniref:Neur_chan_LBD domain-containing protein n=1 Tax=Heterorhabditis bacteriophora TaxID=37862 RepID=A0A1I7WDT1_HETBA